MNPLHQAAKAQLERLTKRTATLHMLRVVIRQMHGLRRHNQGEAKAVTEAASTLIGMICHDIDQAALDAILVSDLSNMKDIRKEVNELVYGWFMDGHAGVMHLLSTNGVSPGRYLTVVSDDLKRELQQALRDELPDVDLPTDTALLQSMVRQRDHELLNAMGLIGKLRQELRNLKDPPGV